MAKRYDRSYQSQHQTTTKRYFRGSAHSTTTPRIPGHKIVYRDAPPVAGPLERTFAIFGDAGMDHGPLRRMLGERGFREITRFEGASAPVGWLVCEQTLSRYDARISALTSRVKSIMSSHKMILCDKANLHAHLSQSHPHVVARHMAPTWPSEAFSRLEPGQVVIFKGTGTPAAGGGKANHIATTPAELALARSATSKYPRTIVSSYIRNPWRFQGRKCHLRMYLLVRSPVRCTACLAAPSSAAQQAQCAACGGRQSMPSAASLWAKGRILTARAPYEDARFEDAAIHDSHVGSTDANFTYPDDLTCCHAPGACPTPVCPPLDSFRAQMVEITSAMHEVLCAKMQDRPWTYPESNFTYEVFGVDFLLTDDARVILLECNEKIGSLCRIPQIYQNWPPLNTRDQTPPAGGGKILEGPGLNHWDVRGLHGIDHDTAKKIEQWTTFSGEFFDWVYHEGVLPFYDFFDSQTLSSPSTSLISCSSLTSTTSTSNDECD